MTERKLFTTWADVPLEHLRLFADFVAALAGPDVVVVRSRSTKDGHGVIYFIDEPLPSRATVEAVERITSEPAVREVPVAQRLARPPYPVYLYPGCPCYACDSETWSQRESPERMSICPKCGNKRCPGAAHHVRHVPKESA